MPLSSLSVELVYEIASLLGLRTQNALRATCSSLCAALDPLVFSTLTLRIRIENLERDLSRLRVLAEGATPFSRYVRRVNIAEVTPYEFYWGTDNLKDPKIGEQKELWLVTLWEALKPALSTLNGVRTVHWTASRDDPKWAVGAIVGALATWELTEFSYVCNLVDALPALGLFSGASLQKLTFSSSYPENLNLRELTTFLHHTPKLVSLHIETSFSIRDRDLVDIWADIWVVLQMCSVNLRELTVNIVSPTLCDYLASYTGLERLELLNIDQPAISLQSADLFFEHALRQHSPSLVELCLYPHFSSHWSFGTHNVDVLSSLVRLERLEIPVDPEYGYARLQQDVTLLLDMVTRLPAMRVLSIETTMHECDRYAGLRMTGTDAYCTEVHGWVRGVMGGYRYRDELDASKRSSVEVHVPYLRWPRYYLRMVEAEDGDGWIYVPFDGTRRVAAEVEDDGY